MRTDAASQCISCHEAWVSAALLGALVGAFFTMLGAYNFLLLTHPAALKNWVATGSIIDTNMTSSTPIDFQTASTRGSMCLYICACII